MVSTTFILSKIHQVQNNSRVTILELEDLITRDQPDLFTLIYYLRNFCDRSWERIQYIDTIQPDRFEWWKQSRIQIIRGFEEIAPGSSDIVNFRVSLAVSEGTSALSLIDLLKQIRLDRTICSIEFSGALYGIEDTEIPERMVNLLGDAEKQLREVMNYLVIDLYYDHSPLPSPAAPKWSNQLHQCIKALEKALPAKLCSSKATISGPPRYDQLAGPEISKGSDVPGDCANEDAATTPSVTIANKSGESLEGPVSDESNAERTSNDEQLTNPSQMAQIKDPSDTASLQSAGMSSTDCQSTKKRRSIKPAPHPVDGGPDYRWDLKSQTNGRPRIGRSKSESHKKVERRGRSIIIPTELFQDNDSVAMGSTQMHFRRRNGSESDMKAGVANSRQQHSERLENAIGRADTHKTVPSQTTACKKPESFTSVTLAELLEALETHKTEDVPRAA